MSVLTSIATEDDRATLLELVETVQIAPGEMQVCLDPAMLANAINSDPDRLDESILIQSVPFQLRKRGVETKITLADALSATDDTLIRNIARALAWIERINAGETFGEVAATEGTPKHRIQILIGLAVLASDIIRDVLDASSPSASLPSGACATSCR